MRPVRCCIRGLLVVLFLAPAAACAPSAKIAYARHLSAIVPSGPAPDNDVAIAFRLDEYASPDPETAIAAGTASDPSLVTPGR